MNAASKATPPRAAKKDPNYFQPETISAILEALESEPLKWQLITHLLIVTGCRRGEIMGLKWEKADFENNRIKIDRALIVSPSKGAYESTTKTSDVRYLTLPEETMKLLRQHKRDQLRLHLGHASASKTENFYAHIIEENKAKASGCIADVLLRKKA